MRGLWICLVCGHENSAAHDDCTNSECGEAQRLDRIIAGARYAALHGIKRPPEEDHESWKWGNDNN